MEKKFSLIVFTDLDGSLLHRDTFKFDPIKDYIKDSWRSLTTKGGIIPRTKHTAEWTGSELFVFGGLSKLSDTQTSRNVRISEPQILDTQKTWHLFRKLK